MIMTSRESRNTFWSAERPGVLNLVGGFSLRVWRRSKVTLRLFVRADDQQPHGSGKPRPFTTGRTWRTLSPVFLARRVCSAAFNTFAALLLSSLLLGPEKTQRETTELHTQPPTRTHLNTQRLKVCNNKAHVHSMTGTAHRRCGSNGIFVY